MLTSFIQYLQTDCKINSSDSLLVAVSGGIDSVVLCHLFSEANVNFGIAHCNFQLRGSESDRDADFVATLAVKYRVPYFSTAFNTLQIAKEQKISVQMAARNLRYQWLETTRQQQNFRFIATAHHQNDIAETMLYNLTKGTGIAGLHGIFPKRNKLVRPLLFANKVSIVQYARQHHLVYRTDSSNQETKYSRNKIRHLVIPVLKEINPNLEQTFADNTARFTEIENIYKAGIAHYKKKLLEGNEKERFISIAKLKNILPIINTILYEILHPYGFSMPQIKQIITAMEAEPGKVFYSKHYQLIKDRKHFVLMPKSARDASFLLIHDATQTHITLGNVELYLSQHTKQNMIFNYELNNVAYFDADKIVYPLRLRYKKEGDYFYPFGMKMKKKKLKRYFIDQKLHKQAKEEVLILNDGKERIMWVIGYRTDERFKISRKTQNVLQIRFENT